MMQKLFNEIKRFVLNPIEAFTTAVETVSEWSASRRWLKILPVLPIAIAMIGVYTYAWIGDSAGATSRVRKYFEQMDEKYPLNRLEAILYRDVIRLNGKPLTEGVSIQDRQASGGSASAARSSGLLNEELEPPTKETLNEFNLALNRIDQFQPDNNDVAYRRAVVFALQGKLSEADEIIAKLTNSNSLQSQAANHWQAVNLLNKRLAGVNVTDAVFVRVFSIATEWRSVRPEIQLAFAGLLLRQEKIDQALELMFAASDKVPDQLLVVAELAKRNNRDRLFQQAVSKAEKYYRSKLDTAAETATDRISYANSQLMMERKQVAIEILNAGIVNSSIPQPELKQKLSDVYLSDFLQIQGTNREELVPEAMDMLKQAIDADPLNPQLGRVIAMFLADEKFPTEKIPKLLLEVLQKQISANKVAPATLMVIGGMYYRQGKLPLAETAWGKVVEIVPDAVDALNNLAVLEFSKASPDKEKALTRISRAFELAPNNVEVCDSYGQVLFEMGRFADAIAMYERALRISSNRPQTRKQLAKCYASIGQAQISEAQTRLVSAQEEEEVKKQAEEAKATSSDSSAEQGEASATSDAKPNEKLDENPPVEASPPSNDTSAKDASEDPSKDKAAE